jgi:hypothetical protein
MSMVQGITGQGQIGVVAISALRAVQSDGQSVVVPVRPSQAVYANFSHIRVRPDWSLQDGIPLYKLRILDTLMERYSRTGTAGRTGEPAGGAGLAALSASGQGRKDIDSLINSLSQKLRVSAGDSFSYRAGFLPEPGTFLDLVA